MGENLNKKVASLFGLIFVVGFTTAGLFFLRNKFLIRYDNYKYDLSVKRERQLRECIFLLQIRTTNLKSNNRISTCQNNIKAGLLAIEKNKGNEQEFYRERGITKNFRGDYLGSVKDLSKAIDINPYDYLAHVFRGIANRGLDKDQTAIADLDWAIGLKNNSLEFCLPYYERGKSKYLQNNYAGALADLNKAIDICPNKFDAFYQTRAMVNYRLNNPSGELSDINKAIELNPHNPEHYTHRGMHKHDQKDYSGAIDDQNKAIKINPRLGLAYNNRAVSKVMGLKDDKGSCDDYKKAASLGFKPAIRFLKTPGARWCTVDDGIKKRRSARFIYRPELMEKESD